MQFVNNRIAKFIILFVLWTSPFVIPCFGQGLVLNLSGNRLVITNSEELLLSYLPADQFQKLDWEPGYAYYPDGSSRKFDGMKYDPAEDLIQVNTGGYILTLLPGVIDGVSMEIEDVVTRIFVKVPLKNAVFMEVLSTGKLNLLVYRKLKGESNRIDNNTVTVRFEKEEEIIEYDELLYVWGPDGVDKLKSSKKEILSLMEDHSSDVDKFLADSKISMKDIGDLKKVFDYYSELD